MPLPGHFRWKTSQKDFEESLYSYSSQKPTPKEHLLEDDVLNQNLSTHVTKHRFCDEIHHGKCIKKTASCQNSQATSGVHGGVGKGVYLGDTLDKMDVGWTWWQH